MDAALPSSSVQELPEATSDSAFAVEWSGQDPSGSGVHSYSVFVSKDGGSFQPWRTGTPATSDTFDAELGYTYRFYSLARDTAGNLEPGKSSAEASIQVGQTVSVWPGDTDNDGGVDEQDVLPVGMHYGETGPARTLPTDFAASSVVPWSPEEATYADANGTGAVDQNDILPSLSPI